MELNYKPLRVRVAIGSGNVLHGPVNENGIGDDQERQNAKTNGIYPFGFAKINFLIDRLSAFFF